MFPPGTSVDLPCLVVALSRKRPNLAWPDRTLRLGSKTASGWCRAGGWGLFGRLVQLLLAAPLLVAVVFHLLGEQLQ